MRVAFLVAVLSAAATPLYAQPAIYTIRDDATGGDCRRLNIGLWNRAAKTCRLIRNVRASIEIADDKIKLFGNQRTVTPGPQPMPFGVLLQGRRDVVVSGLRIDSFAVGISVDGGRDNTLIQNILTNTAGGFIGIGIDLIKADWITVRANLVSGYGTAIAVDGGGNNRILKNQLLKNAMQLQLTETVLNLVDGNRVTGLAPVWSDAILMTKAHDNRLSWNSVTQQGGVAAELADSDRNLFVYNTFTTNGAPAALSVTSGTGNQAICNDFTANNPLAVRLNGPAVSTLVLLNNFYGTDTAQDNAVPAGVNVFDNGADGNHWAINTPACLDLNGDGKCDAPYVFPANRDNRPFVKPVPWRADPAMCFPAAPATSVTGGDAWFAAREWALAVANGDTAGIARRLAPDVEVTLPDGRVVRGVESVVVALKPFTGTRFAPEAIDVAPPKATVRASGVVRTGSATAVAVTMELLAAPGRPWHIVRIRFPRP